jgi:tRNA (adenine37-N6)-methyltransferase
MQRNQMDIIYRPIGVIHSPFADIREMPIQPTGKSSAPGTAELLPEFVEGLRDLDGFTHVILIYHLHKVSSTQLTVRPFLSSETHGVFATRAPTRPNPIGISIVRLLSIEKNVLHLGNLDVLDGSPLLDVKPYVPEFDTPPDAQAGWLEHAQARAKTTKSDDRFG